MVEDSYRRPLDTLVLGTQDRTVLTPHRAPRKIQLLMHRSLWMIVDSAWCKEKYRSAVSSTQAVPGVSMGSDCCRVTSVRCFESPEIHHCELMQCF